MASKKKSIMGILQYSLNQEYLVYFENKPTLNTNTGVWNPFVFSFDDEDDLIKFYGHQPLSFIIKRLLSDGFVMETYNFMAVDDIIQTGDGRGITIFFKNCSYLN